MSKKPYWNEEWKLIKLKGISKPEKYQVSNYGRIRRWKPNINDWKMLKTARIKGYVYYSFKSKEHWSKKISKCVHRLVAESFCERSNAQKKYVIHKDFVKDNNYFENLEWVTKDGMYLHQQENPNYEKAREKLKGRITNAKLTTTQVIRIKKKLQRGTTPLYKIAKEFGITHTQLNRIKKGENWGHITI